MCSTATALEEKNPLTAENISELRQLLKEHNDGSNLLVPGDEGYEDSIKRWSAAAVRRAPASLVPGSAETISVVLPWVVKHNIDLAIKGGSHSSGGASSTSEGLVIDLSHLSQTIVDPTAKTLRVGGGANWGQVDVALASHNLATVGGTVPDTGVGGLTLGGGYGFLSGKHGLVIDNLISVKVVLASGEIVTASNDQNQDLFWGLRGAGQNFGVAVEFELRAYEQGEVWAGPLIFPPIALPKVTEIMGRLIPSLKGKAGSGIGFARPPPAGGQAVVLVPVFYNGSEEDGKKDFKELLDLGPIVNDIKPMPYQIANTLMSISPGFRGSLKGVTYNLPIRPDFAQQVFEKYAQFTEAVPDAAPSLVLFELLDMTKVCQLATNKDMAFANRGMYLNGVVCPLWNDATNDDTCRQFARDLEAVFAHELEHAKKAGETDAEKYAVMRYGNYEHYDQKGKDVFGINHDRLAPLKKKYDPTNIFDKLFAVMPAA